MSMCMHALHVYMYYTTYLSSPAAVHVHVHACTTCLYVLHYIPLFTSGCTCPCACMHYMSICTTLHTSLHQRLYMSMCMHALHVYMYYTAYLSSPAAVHVHVHA